MKIDLTTLIADLLDQQTARIAELEGALKGVLRVADRKTVEFDIARAALYPPATQPSAEQKDTT